MALVRDDTAYDRIATAPSGPKDRRLDIQIGMVRWIKKNLFNGVFIPSSPS